MPVSEVAYLSSPISHGCRCQLTRASLSTSHRHHCCQHAGFVALVIWFHHYGGILAVVAPALLHGCYQPCGGSIVANVAWRLCQRCLHVVAIAALMLLPLKSHGGHRNDALALLPPWRWCLCQHCSGISAVVALTSLPLVSSPTSHGHCLQHCMGAVAKIARALSTLPRRRCCQHHLGVVTIVALASSPLLRWRLFQRCLDVDAIIALTSYSLSF